LTNQHRWVRRVVSVGLLVGMIYHSARSQQRGELQASTQTALSPSATTATVLVDSYCTWTSYNNNIPVVHYVTDNAVNGRYDNFALDNQPSAPPGFSISFSVATTTGPNVVYASVPMSIDPASPVGYYAAAIVADATTSSPHSCLNGSGQGNQQIAAYFGTVNYTVNAILQQLFEPALALLLQRLLRQRQFRTRPTIRGTGLAPPRGMYRLARGLQGLTP